MGYDGYTRLLSMLVLDLGYESKPVKGLAPDRHIEDWEACEQVFTEKSMQVRVMALIAQRRHEIENLGYRHIELTAEQIKGKVLWAEDRFGV